MNVNPRLVKLLSLAVLSLLILGAAFYAYRQASTIAVKLVDVRQGELNQQVFNTAPGTVNACNRKKFSIPAEIQVTRLLVSEGDALKAGDTILGMWNDNLHKQVKSLERKVLALQRQEDKLCQEARWTLEKNRQLSKLYERGIVFEDEYSQAVYQAQTKRNACVNAKIKHIQAHDNLVAARKGLKRVDLKAPFDGIIGNIEGMPQHPGTQRKQPVIIDLIDNTCMMVTAPVQQQDIGKVALGQSSVIELNVLPDQHFEGRVKYIHPLNPETVEPDTPIDVDVEFLQQPQQGQRLLGYSAGFGIIYRTKKNIVLIPRHALLPDNTVLLYGDDNRLKKQPVTPGIHNGRQVEIQSGLVAGQQIVAHPDQPGLTDGQRIEPLISTLAEP